MSERGELAKPYLELAWVVTAPGTGYYAYKPVESRNGFAVSKPYVYRGGGPTDEELAEQNWAKVVAIRAEVMAKLAAEWLGDQPPTID